MGAGRTALAIVREEKPKLGAFISPESSPIDCVLSRTRRSAPAGGRYYNHRLGENVRFSRIDASRSKTSDLGVELCALCADLLGESSDAPDRGSDIGDARGYLADVR